jgi:hypothetical protein
VYYYHDSRLLAAFGINIVEADPARPITFRLSALSMISAVTLEALLMQTLKFFLIPSTHPATDGDHRPPLIRVHFEYGHSSAAGCRSQDFSHHCFFSIYVS